MTKENISFARHFLNSADTKTEIESLNIPGQLAALADMDITPKVTLALGGHNIFNTRPETRDTTAPFNGAGNIFQYRGISPFDYTGAFYYVRVRKEF